MGVICSYLTVPEILCRLGTTTKQLVEKVRNDTLWRILLYRWSQDGRLHDQFARVPQLANSITHVRLTEELFRQISKEKGINTAALVTDLLKGIKVHISSKDNHLEIEGVQSSTQDFNQSIYRTLDRNSFDFFWSSTGSTTPIDNEWLLYRVSNGKALIHSLAFALFKSRYQEGDPLYPPREIQIQVGDTPFNYHYTSPRFFVEPNNDKEQLFPLMPDIVIGEYIKILLIGKPAI